jgi:Fur family ferric uptake transcriptional regulator
MQKSAVDKLTGYLADQGLKSTKQRDAILKIFAGAQQHLNADELYVRVKKVNPGIGYATVYRTLKLLAEAGLAEECRFEDGFSRFEYKNGNAHHDHLVCTRCGTIIEFENARIEALQHDVAKEKGFTVHSHKMDLYGLCVACQQNERGSRKK